MTDLRALYQEVILDHNKHPRNYRKMEDADRVIEGYNPLCGDHYTVYVKYDGDEISDISFEGSGCAISKASASVMSTVVKGMTKKDAELLFARFRRLVTGDEREQERAEELGKLAAFGGVSEFPARVKCAILAWHSLHGALQGDVTTVTTE